MAASRPFEWLRRRGESVAQRWSRRRQGLDRIPLTLHTRRLYILPTASGLLFAATVLAILAAGLNYANGLVLLLGFLLAGTGLSGLHQTHRRLLGLVVESLTLDGAHAGSALSLRLCLGEARGQAADDYQLSLRDEHGKLLQAHGEGPAEAPTFTLLPVATQRGRWQLPPLRLDCEAPTGLFRCWVWLHMEASALVFPRPAGNTPMPAAPDDEGHAEGSTSGQEEWFALRPFRDGDSPRHAAWKSHARGQPLQSREWRGLSGNRHVFDYTQLAGLDLESRVSQLTAWVLEATRRGDSFALQLPGRRIETGSGAQHQQDCLEALALHGLPT